MKKYDGGTLKILGIDEAGRGPVIGPLVMCGYLVDEGNVPKLEKLGVKDSKLLSPKKRESLIPELKKICDDFILLKMTASEIDKLRNVTNLNKLEIERMQQIIKMFEPDRVIIDALEANTKRFSCKVCNGLKIKSLVAENFADKNYLEVGAASILAKVHRDDEIKKLHKKYGFFGTGYPSDERTINFLKNWIKRNKEFPDFVRKSWLTAQLIKEEKEQSRLLDFLMKNNGSADD
jgi:ribonuclease HII